MSHSIVRILPRYVKCETLFAVLPATEKDGCVVLYVLDSWISTSVFFVLITRPAHLYALATTLGWVIGKAYDLYKTECC